MNLRTMGESQKLFPSKTTKFRKCTVLLSVKNVYILKQVFFTCKLPSETSESHKEEVHINLVLKLFHLRI